MATTSTPPSFPSTTVDNTSASISSSTSVFTTIPHDILRAHILTRLDGLSLVSTACTSNELHSLSSQEDLWANICHSTWPSTSTPRLRHVISNFPSGPRSFFSHSFPLLLLSAAAAASPPMNRDRPPSELISAVDIFYRGDLIFSKVVETETASGWFRCSPFRIDMLEPKDTCHTPIPHPESIDMCQRLGEDLTLSWILVDPDWARAMNVSGQRPVSVQRHWLSGEVHAQFSVVLAGGSRSGRGRRRGEWVQCGIVVTCGGGVEGGGMHVRGVTLQVEDLDGAYLNGKEALGILDGAFEGRKGISGRRVREGKRRYEEFLEMKRERKERELKLEGTLDMLCVGFGVLLFATLGLYYLLCR
ncbi:hypothetical protein Tsubulata_044288 [Turnera subulata]|uniref:F-box domain-containing protein n=1 Tax=Turnera subulata TaxID=218843 RepID=A0A9Q0GJY2_9ROSI|nr:hypothetical protein Tsubulata_044288 [Turnera subulata]